MRIENNRKVRNRRNSFIPNKTISIRAETAFFDLCDKVAKSENTSRNELIVRVVMQYCKKGSRAKE